MTEKHPFTNRLITEMSPYLLQHARNPVDWYPWGEEAFRKAREEDKPIFLSIGYATCHWCHVMEKESFESQDVAQALNQGFINIKVDREELPEVDQLYMDFAQAIMSSSAGWPLNLFLTPDLYPFFATTYLPPRTAQGMPGIKELADQIQKLWKGGERDQILDQARQIVEIFQSAVITYGTDIPDKSYASIAIDNLLKHFDTVYGGLKGAPKFPMGYQYALMMHHSYLERDSRPMYIVEKTLNMMYRGGIYDHLGGGFSRYSVDEQWLVPHFEKMLYDNALLIDSYCDAWKATKRPIYKNVGCEVVEYILNHLTSPEGGFYSAEDADSEGEEGKFYTWTIDEVEEVLGVDDGELFCQVFGLTSQGNFEGKNILHLPSSYEEYAHDRRLDLSSFEEKIKSLRLKLYQHREKRVRPFKDDKILSSWNGLMIHSMLEAGRAFHEPRYVDAAVAAASFVREKLWMNGVLFRRYREGAVDFHGGLDEYAFMLRATLSLFEAGCGTKWLQWAMEIEELLRLTFKAEEGAFYQTNGMDPNLILRQCLFSDGAEPSGNAVHCENLLRLAMITYDPSYRKQAEDILKAAKGFLEYSSPGYCFHYRNLLRYHQRNAPTIIVALNHNNEGRSELERMLFETYLPHRAIIWVEPNDKILFELIPAIKGQPTLQERTTVYLCHNQVCEKPMVDIDEVKTAIGKLYN